VGVDSGLTIMCMATVSAMKVCALASDGGDGRNTVFAVSSIALAMLKLF